MKEVKVPILPESISEATVAAWHKKPGDYVEIDDVIVEIETDKVVLEVPAEESGVLSEILEKEGETVSENQVLGLLDDEAKEVEVEAPADEVVGEVPTEESPAEEEVVAEVSAEEVEVEEAKLYAAKGTAYPATIDTLRKIVKDKQHQTVMFKSGKAIVDLFTASAMVQVYDALKKPEMKKTFEKMIGDKAGFLKTQEFAMKMISGGK